MGKSSSADLEPRYRYRGFRHSHGAGLGPGTSAPPRPRGRAAPDPPPRPPKSRLTVPTSWVDTEEAEASLHGSPPTRAQVSLGGITRRRPKLLRRRCTHVPVHQRLASSLLFT
jgi:hypothetical protein